MVSSFTLIHTHCSEVFFTYQNCAHKHGHAKLKHGRACDKSVTVQENARQTRPSQNWAWLCHIELKEACKADTAKPKSGLAVPHGCFRMRKFFQEFYAIGTLHNLSVGEELGLGLNFY